MIEAPFLHHRLTALCLLNKLPELQHNEAGFLGHVCVAPDLSDKQRAWLRKLLERHGLPRLAGGSGQ